MSLIRGIRSMVQEYSRSYIVVNDKNEDIGSNVLLAVGDDEDCAIQIVNLWPETIMLTAKMIPEKRFNETLYVEATKDTKSLGRNSIYSSSSIFCSTSEIKNNNSICSKLVLRYEGSGVFSINQKKRDFFGNSFDDYELNFAKDTVLFEKEFLALSGSISEQITEKMPYKIYPYGGFYEYGVHPKEIASCFFHIKPENSKSTITSWAFNKFMAKFGVDPSKDSRLPSGQIFIGIKEFSPSQKMNLYDEVLGGTCGFLLANKSTGEQCRYKSNNLSHISGTDLIKIVFIREE